MNGRPIPIGIEFVRYEVDVNDPSGTEHRQSEAERRVLDLMAQGFVRLDMNIGQPNSIGQYAVIITMALVEE